MVGHMTPTQQAGKTVPGEHAAQNIELIFLNEKIDFPHLGRSIDLLAIA